MKAFLATIGIIIGVFIATAIGVGIGAGIKYQDGSTTQSVDKIDYEILSDEDTSIEGSKSRLLKLVPSKTLNKEEMVNLSKELAVDPESKYTFWFYNSKSEFEDGRAYTLGMIDIDGNQVKHTNPISPGSSASSSSNTSVSETTSNHLTVEGFDFEYDSYTAYAVGRITNTLGRPLGYLAVRINLFDESGNLIGTTLDNVTNVAPGDTWIFRAPILERNASKAQVVDIDYSY